MEQNSSFAKEIGPLVADLDAINAGWRDLRRYRDAETTEERGAGALAGVGIELSQGDATERTSRSRDVLFRNGVDPDAMSKHVADGRADAALAELGKAGTHVVDLARAETAVTWLENAKTRDLTGLHGLERVEEAVAMTLALRNATVGEGLNRAHQQGADALREWNETDARLYRHQQEVRQRMSAREDQGVLGRIVSSVTGANEADKAALVQADMAIMLHKDKRDSASELTASRTAASEKISIPPAEARAFWEQAGQTVGGVAVDDVWRLRTRATDIAAAVGKEAQLVDARAVWEAKADTIFEHSGDDLTKTHINTEALGSRPQEGSRVAINTELWNALRRASDYPVATKPQEVPRKAPAAKM